MVFDNVGGCTKITLRPKILEEMWISRFASRLQKEDSDFLKRHIFS